MRSAVIAVLAVLAFSTSIAAAQPSQTLTLEPVCTGDAGGYFNYDIEIIVTGLGPWGPAVGSVETPDGFQIGPTGFSAGADGTARINVNSIFPGVFEVRVYEPFKARERLYVDCGRPRPVERAACNGQAWQGWRFASRRECFQYVQAAKECAYQHYHGNDVTPCPPRLPNEA
jgi:hypothetical protein